MKSVAWRLFLGLLVLACILGAAASLSRSGLLLNNTLVYNGSWVSGKEALDIKVMGAPAFMRRTQALAGGQLNLDAWHGYQEVLLRDRTKLRRAAFDFSVAPDGYFAFVMKEARKYTGILISANEKLKSVYFVADASGQFLERHELALPEIPVDAWNQFELERGDSGGLLRINGALVKTPPITIPLFCQPGFRGGLKHSAIDNVVFQNQYFAFEDTFLVTDEKVRYFLLAVLVLCLLAILLLWAQSLVGIPTDKSIAVTALFHLTVAVLAAALPLWLARSTASYPSPQSLQREETAYLYNQWDWRSEEVLQAVATQSRDGDQMVLFLGSSQTFGAGASKEDEAFVSVIQRRFNEREAEQRVLCVNTGINGAGMPTIGPLYERDWLGLNPALVVVNFGINDRWNPREEFAASLERIFELNQQHGIRTLFVLEPYSWDWSDYESDSTESGASPREIHTHTTMRTVAERHGIPLVDLNPVLNRKIEEGFLWWDFVHPTSFGHRLIAEILFDEVVQLLP